MTRLVRTGLLYAQLLFSYAEVTLVMVDIPKIKLETCGAAGTAPKCEQKIDMLDQLFVYHCGKKMNPPPADADACYENIWNNPDAPPAPHDIRSINQTRRYQFDPLFDGDKRIRILRQALQAAAALRPDNATAAPAVAPPIVVQAFQMPRGQIRELVRVDLLKDRIQISEKGREQKTFSSKGEIPIPSPDSGRRFFPSFSFQYVCYRWQNNVVFQTTDGRMAFFSPKELEQAVFELLLEPEASGNLQMKKTGLESFLILP